MSKLLVVLVNIKGRRTYVFVQEKVVLLRDLMVEIVWV